MIKAKILKGAEITHAAEFENQPAAEAWVAQNKSAFGKLERWLKQNQFTTEKIYEAIDTEEREDGVYYKFPQTFSVQYEDISAQKAAEKKIADRKAKRMFGQMLIDKIATMNDAKGLSMEQVDAFMRHPTISILKAHLEAGNIDTFIFKLNNSDVADFFSTPEKQAVITECETFLSNLGG